MRKPQLCKHEVFSSFHFHKSNYYLVWPHFRECRKFRNVERKLFKDNNFSFCQSCSVEERLTYIEHSLDLLGRESNQNSVNWFNNWSLALACMVTSLTGSLISMVVTVIFQQQYDKKFKIWEGENQIKFLEELNRCQFPPSAEFRSGILPEQR